MNQRNFSFFPSLTCSSILAIIRNDGTFLLSFLLNRFWLIDLFEWCQFNESKIHSPKSTASWTSCNKCHMQTISFILCFSISNWHWLGEGLFLYKALFGKSPACSSETISSASIALKDLKWNMSPECDLARCSWINIYVRSNIITIYILLYLFFTFYYIIIVFK